MGGYVGFSNIGEKIIALAVQSRLGQRSATTPPGGVAVRHRGGGVEEGVPPWGEGCGAPGMGARGGWAVGLGTLVPGVARVV